MRFALAVAGLAFALVAQAQQFPSKPVTLIVPWPAGGSTDIYFRKLGAVSYTHLRAHET